MEKLKELFSKSWTLSSSNKVKHIIKTFSIGERVIFYFLVTVFTISGLALLWQVNTLYMVETPTHGGTITEGVIGSPRFVNPLLAMSDADRDLTTLVYSGLLKQNSAGKLAPDLAQSYTLSPDGLTYTFILKNKIVFQDGTPITPDDILFTIQRAQDAGLKSPKESIWDGVRVTKVDNTTISFTLKQQYAPFIYNMTLGILPKHIWKDVSDDSFPFSTLNTRPTGSGPYKVSKVVTDSSGLPTEYDLTANPNYVSGEPYITHITMKFYSNENDLINAYNKGDVSDINSITPSNIPLLKKSSDAVLTPTLSRVFGVFWNQSSAPVLVNTEVRQALEQALDKPTLIKQVLGGYGVPLDGPLPTNIDTTGTLSEDTRIAQAQATLEKAGWAKNANGIYQKIDKKTKKPTATLAFSLSTSDAPELKALAEAMQNTWTKLGAQVDVKIFEIGDLNQNIIRPRKYDALLFGEIITPGKDLYPFWHSSQRNDPGLNIALYANIKADKILENLRTTNDPQTIATLQQSFEKEISADSPAIFLYAPDLIYVVPNNIHNISLGQLTVASDRFAGINTWYIETTNVWRVFQ